MVSMCLAKFHGMGQQQQQGAMLTGVVCATAVAAQLMKMIYASRVHQATDTAETGSASSFYHDYVSSHFYQLGRYRCDYFGFIQVILASL